VVSQIKVGEHGHAYVVDAQGRLIAHPDISLVLRNTDMSRLAQVRAARSGAGGSPSETVQEADNIEGRKVLTAYAPVVPLNWLVFVELPADEAYAPLCATPFLGVAHPSHRVAMRQCDRGAPWLSRARSASRAGCLITRYSLVSRSPSARRGSG
jgi:hypothetical protein